MTNEAKNKIPKKMEINTNNNNTGNGAVSFPEAIVKSRGYVHKLMGPSLINLHKILFRLVDRGMNILIVGDRGTGKELAATFFAEASRLELAAINCASTAENLLESELFGHVKGAFTTAIIDRPGYIITHHKKGIIFLDEIGDASDHFQALLLRYLETGDFSPLGSDIIEKKYKATIISATSMPEKMREDLKDRFVSVVIPPLIDRKGDIPGLIKYLWDNESEKDTDKRPQYISHDVLKAFENYQWPGNVRELKKCLLLAEILCEIRNGKTLRTNDFPILKGRFVKKDSSRKRIIANLKSEGEAKSITEFLQVPENKNHDIENGDKSQVEQMPIEFYFERVSPYKYEPEFWEYHAKNGRRGVEINRLFDIDSSTANRHLKKAKARLCPFGKRA